LRRVPGAKVLGVGHVVGRRLQFHKRSTDGSGKCDIPKSTNPSDTIHGVLFDIPDHQISNLDDAEGVGHGYERTTIEVTCDSTGSTTATVYLATPDSIDSSLAPYDWYHRLVLVGARQHHLPPVYISEIAAVPVHQDPKPDRKSRLEALQALSDANEQ